MRKEIITPYLPEGEPTQSSWIDVDTVARVELSSEDAAHPVESALKSGAGPGWLAAQPGPQTIRLIFDQPVQLRRIYLEFIEREVARPQEFVLRWSPDQGRSYREIVRQQFNFDPPGTIVEREEYQVDLYGMTRLELQLTPALGNPGVRASLTRWLLA